jgi:hypothetical protein
MGRGRQRTASRDQAARAEMGAVAVAGHHEEFGAFCGRDDFGFAAPGPFDLPALPSQSGSGLVEQFCRRGGFELFDPRARVPDRVAAPEQTGEGPVRDIRGFGFADVQQHEVDAGRRVPSSGIHARRPGRFDDPGDHRHGYQPPSTCNDAHSASSAAISAAGIVSSPSTVNSARPTSWSC